MIHSIKNSRDPVQFLLQRLTSKSKFLIERAFFNTKVGLNTSIPRRNLEETPKEGSTENSFKSSKLKVKTESSCLTLECPNKLNLAVSKSDSKFVLSPKELSQLLVTLVKERKVKDASQIWLDLLQQGLTSNTHLVSRRGVLLIKNPDKNTEVDHYDPSIMPYILHALMTSFIFEGSQASMKDQVCAVNKPELSSSTSFRRWSTQETSFFHNSFFIEYLLISDSDRSKLPLPFPSTFELTIRWLTSNSLFEEAAHVWLEMQRFDVMPRKNLLPLIFHHWVVKISSQQLIDSIFLGAFPNLFGEYIKASPLCLELLVKLKGFLVKIVQDSRRTSKSVNSVTINLIRGFLKLRNGLEAFRLFRCTSSVLTEEELEEVYVMFLEYYSVSVTTSDLYYFNSLSDHLLNLPFAPPSQIPSRAYFLNCQKTPLFPNAKSFEFLPISVLKAIVNGYSYHQEFESLAQLLQLLKTGYFKGVTLTESFYEGIFDGLALHGDLSACYFFLKQWRKQLGSCKLNHPWFPELFMIEKLSCHRHRELLPRVLNKLLSSSERRQEILADPSQGAEYLFNFFSHLHRQNDVSELITEALVDSDGTPPILWAGWLTGFIKDGALTSDGLRFHDRYMFNPAHKAFPAISFKKFLARA